MTDLRKEARGKPCYMRFGECSGQDTVVLCHIRRGHIAGRGQKPQDLCALPGCFNCHQQYDGQRYSTMSTHEMDAEVLRGLVQWLDWLVKHGKIKY